MTRVGIAAAMLGVSFVATPGSQSAAASRCLSVPMPLIRAIQTGLDPGLRLRAGRAVKSRDFRSVYFVSGDIQGPGLRGTRDIATWATNKLRVGGLIYSAEAVAREFSDWGRGPGFSFDDDGLRESQSCVRRALTG
jgi:hypothetical protein